MQNINYQANYLLASVDPSPCWSDSALPKQICFLKRVVPQLTHLLRDIKVKKIEKKHATKIKLLLARKVQETYAFC